LAGSGASRCLPLPWVRARLAVLSEPGSVQTMRFLAACSPALKVARAMYRVPGVLSAVPTRSVSRVQPVPGLPPGSPPVPEGGRAPVPAEAIASQAEDRE